MVDVRNILNREGVRKVKMKLKRWQYINIYIFILYCTVLGKIVQNTKPYWVNHKVKFTKTGMEKKDAN